MALITSVASNTYNWTSKVPFRWVSVGFRRFWLDFFSVSLKNFILLSSSFVFSWYFIFIRVFRWTETNNQWSMVMYLIKDAATKHSNRNSLHFIRFYCEFSKFQYSNSDPEFSEYFWKESKSIENHSMKLSALLCVRCIAVSFKWSCIIKCYVLRQFKASIS